jgi:hypothetical protein
MPYACTVCRRSLSLSKYTFYLSFYLFHLHFVAIFAKYRFMSTTFFSKYSFLPLYMCTCCHFCVVIHVYFLSLPLNETSIQFSSLEVVHMSVAKTPPTSIHFVLHQCILFVTLEHFTMYTFCHTLYCV